VKPEWMMKWIRDPKSFRPTTNMPQLFDLSNTSDAKSKERSTAEIFSIVTYLGDKAQGMSAAGVSKIGNAENGKKLFGSIGCLGCHHIDDYKPVSEIDEAAEYQSGRNFGPDLSTVGSKLSPEWLNQWLKNPKNYWPETRMPNLRLSDSEVADLTAYLMSKKNETFDKIENQKVSSAKINEIVLDYLKRKLPTNEALAEYRKMDTKQKILFVGEKSIGFYGCFGCHDIPGFEDAKPIGTELTTEASKPIGRFDFGFIPLEKSVDAWIRQKLKQPRIFDTGRTKEPLDKLHMPYFAFSDDELDSVLTFVMGLRKYSVLESKKPKLTPQRLAIQKGRRLVHDRNCRGCHIIEDTGGEILTYFEDRSMGPPNLKGEGAKIQQDWLYHFFDQVSTIRPYINVRMPSFGFNTDEKNTLIAYFRGLDGLVPQMEENPQIQQSIANRNLAVDSIRTSQCYKCHRMPPYPADLDRSSLAPSLRLAKSRLRYPWVHDWIKDPGTLLPGTRMPNLFFTDGQWMYDDGDQRVSAVRDFLYSAQDVYSAK